MDISSRIGLLFVIVYPSYYYNLNRKSLLSIFTTSIYVTSVIGIVEIQGSGEVLTQIPQNQISIETYPFMPNGDDSQRFSNLTFVRQIP